VHRARALCDKESLPDELSFSSPLSGKTGIVSGRYYVPQPDSENVKAQRYTHLSHSAAIYPDEMWLPQQNVGLLPRKISNFFCPIKDSLGLRTPGMYSIPCKCGQVYIGKPGRSIETRIKEHHWYIQLGHPNKSVVAEHRFN
jgi:hypothetical protein